jgi:type II secretory pathway component PulJ
MKGILKNRSEAGFTLIEILVSFTIVIIVVGMLYGTFRSTINTSEQIDKESGSFRSARVAFYQMTKDIGMLSQKEPNAQTSSLSLSSDTKTPFGAIRLRGADGSRFANGANYPNDSISFASFSAPPLLRGFSESNRVEIAYSISEDVLTRKAQYRNQSVQNEVSDLVLGINFRYFDKKKLEWRDEWDPRDQPESPMAIEVTLIFKGHSDFSDRKFQTTVGIASADVIL